MANGTTSSSVPWMIKTGRSIPTAFALLSKRCRTRPRRQERDPEPSYIGDRSERRNEDQPGARTPPGHLGGHRPFPTTGRGARPGRDRSPAPSAASAARFPPPRRRLVPTAFRRRCRTQGIPRRERPRPAWRRSEIIGMESARSSPFAVEVSDDLLAVEVQERGGLPSGRSGRDTPAPCRAPGAGKMNDVWTQPRTPRPIAIAAHQGNRPPAPLHASSP